MTYSKEVMESVIEEVKTGASSIHGAARKYRISSSILHDHLSEKHTKVGTGGPTVLTYTEEREIVLYLIALGEMGFGLTKISSRYNCERLFNGKQATQSIFSRNSRKRLVDKIQKEMNMYQ